MNKAHPVIVIFFREELFYPVEFMAPAACGKSLRRQAAEHATLNPGTTRVEAVDGVVLWSTEVPA